MSGSPHGVFGWTQPFGVSMKWLASLGGPRIDWLCALTTNTAGAKAPSSAMRSVCMIRRIVTPNGRSAQGLGRAARSDSHHRRLAYPGPDQDVHTSADYCHAVRGSKMQRVTRRKSQSQPRSRFMRRFGRFVMLVAGLFAAVL